MTRRGIACCLLALVAHPVAAGEKYALLVGVREYPEAKTLRPLPYSERDVTELADALRANGFKKDHVTLMTPARGTDGGGRFYPHAQHVRDELKRVLDAAKADDAVLVAFSGHGVTTGDAVYLCPSDAKPGDPNTLIGVRDLYRALGASKAGTKLLLVDAWRADPAAEESPGRPKLPDPPAGVTVVFSASEGERSHDYERLRHGAFFHFVVAGINGDAADKTGEVTVAGLADYLGRKVKDYVRAESGLTQRPEAAGRTTDKTVLVKLGTLSGKWAGKYHYPNDGMAAVDFEMKVVQTGDKLTATVKEPNTFGPNPAQEPHLFARCKGSFDAATGRVTWTKTYDGTDGIGHSVEYAGELSADRKSIEGTWTIKDENGNAGFSGKFALKRAAD